MSLSFSHGCWLSLDVSPVSWSSWVSLTVSHGCWLSFSLSSSFNDFMLVSHCLLWLLAVSLCPLQCYGVTECLSLSPMVAGFLSLSISSHGVATCLSFSLIVACCLSLSLSCHGVAACLSLSPMVTCFLSLSLSSMELLHVSHFLIWLLAASNCLF